MTVKSNWSTLANSLWISITGPWQKFTHSKTHGALLGNQWHTCLSLPTSALDRSLHLPCSAFTWLQVPAKHSAAGSHHQSNAGTLNQTDLSHGWYFCLILHLGSLVVEIYHEKNSWKNWEWRFMWLSNLVFFFLIRPRNLIFFLVLCFFEVVQFNLTQLRQNMKLSSIETYGESSVHKTALGFW